MTSSFCKKVQARGNTIASILTGSPLGHQMDTNKECISILTPDMFLKASPQFSPAHGCGSASTRIYGVALGQRARRTVKYACTLCLSRALYLQAFARPRFALRGEIRAWHPSGRVLPSAVNRPVACRPPPHPLRRWLLPRPGPESNLYVPVPALYRSRPEAALLLLTNKVLRHL